MQKILMAGKQAKEAIHGTDWDQADGRNVMSRRAYHNKVELCIDPTKPVMKAQPQACPVIPPEPESSESSSSAQQPEGAPAAAPKSEPAPGEQAVGGHLNDKVLYYAPGTYPALSGMYAYPAGCKQPQMMAIAPMPQQTQIAIIPAPRALRRPEECKFMKESRRMMFSFQFTLQESIAVAKTLTATLSAQAQKRLADGQDIVGADPTRAEPPRYVVPTSISLVSTTSEAPVPFVAFAPWVAQQPLVIDNGQVGTFVVPPGSRAYSDPEAILYLMSKEKEFTEICKYKYLIDKQVAFLRTQAVATDNNVNFTVNPGTDLFAVLKAFDPEHMGSEGNCAITYPAQVFNETMQRLDETIRMIGRYVQTPDNIKVKLELVRPPSVRPDVTANELLDVVLGGVAVDSEEAKQYYLKKGNRVSVCLDVSYLVLV